MMQPGQILEKIKETEAKAQKIINDAKEEAKKIIEEAQKKAIQIKKEGLEKTEIRKKSLIGRAKLDAEEYAKDLAQKNKKAIEKMEQKFSLKIEEAVQLILKEFKKSYGSS